MNPQISTLLVVYFVLNIFIYTIVSCDDARNTKKGIGNVNFDMFLTVFFGCFIILYGIIKDIIKQHEDV